ncbi:PucR family transcriptional regulator [Kitasatospora sp. NE20-6]|uniref:PucR family transcriptional regulator n=1 Tax=Kitasatospora sp. NE20-6 TaxID=2859066 RepID=UPI0038B3F3EA
MEHSQALADRYGVGQQTVYLLFARQWAWVLDALAIASEQHRTVELELIHHRQDKRVAFLHGLFSGTLGPGEPQASTAEHGLDPDGAYRVFRTAGTDPDTRRRLTEAGFAESYEGGLAGLLTHFPQMRGSELIAVGDELPLAAAPTSFAQASTAPTVALAFGMTGRISIADVPLQAAVMAEKELSDYVLERCFGTIPDRHRPLYQETLAAYLAHDKNARPAAQALHLHPNTLRYRVKRFEDISGLNLDRVDDTVTVWWALQHLHITAHRTTPQSGR